MLEAGSIPARGSSSPVGPVASGVLIKPPFLVQLQAGGQNEDTQ